MDRLKSLLREPALLIDFAETFILMLVAFGLGLSGDQQSYITAAVVAAIGLLKGIVVKPFAVPLVTDFARAALVVFASFGVGLDADQITLVVTLLGTLVTLSMTNRTTPIYDPIEVVPTRAEVVPSGGPVRGEEGSVDRNLVIIACVCIIIITVIVVATAI